MSLNQSIVKSSTFHSASASRGWRAPRWHVASWLVATCVAWLLIPISHLDAQGAKEDAQENAQTVDASTPAATQIAGSEGEIKIWEFSPYEVDVWYAFDGDVALSPVARAQFSLRLHQELERAFRAAWNLRFMEVSPELRGEIVRDFDSLTLDMLSVQELVLVVSTEHPSTRAVRTMEAAVDTFSEIPIAVGDKQRFDSSMTHLPPDAANSVKRLHEKLVVADSDSATLRAQLVSGEIPVAFLPKRILEAQELGDELRPLLTWLPWQPSTLLRQRDKVIMLLIGMDGDEFTFRCREIDCPMQFFGPVFQSRVRHWSVAERVASDTIVRCFAPVARVEEAEARSANIRVRSGGLIVDDENPARLRVGDVMQPIIRRDDRNGLPVLLQPLGFTYAAMTATDGIKGEVNVYTYSGGPGLQGRQNRRTQRVLLRVRPTTERSDVSIAVRGEPGKVQAGCFIYDRDLLTEQFSLVGRTDWRGRLTIQAPARPVGILSEAVRAARLKAKVEAERLERQREEAAQAVLLATRAEGKEETMETDAGAIRAASTLHDTSVAAHRENDDGNDPDVITLNQPLVMLYIKSGDMVLAKLPYVPGQQDVDVAELSDDSLRLKAESFVRGFQGEILDLIGLRNILAARIRLYMKDNQVEKARAALEDFRRLRTFNEMRDQLSQIQRRMLEETGENVPRSARMRIDRMFQTTRDMLQKYLQDDLMAESERLINGTSS
jgi:hypothetical protein